MNIQQEMRTTPIEIGWVEKIGDGGDDGINAFLVQKFT